MSRADHPNNSDHGHDSHGHGGEHVHGLTRSDEVAGVSDARLLWTVVLNQLLTVGQVVAGVLSGSVALLSDAAHNFNDANALLIAYIARRISKKEANERFTFGYRRAELIGAVINLTLLAVVGLYLVYEGIMRFVEPTEIVGWLMAAAALLALVIDVATAVLLWSMSRGSLNVRAAFVHNMVDALGSLAVLVGAGAIIYLDWVWIDPLLTLVIAAYVLWQVVTMVPDAVRILMEGAPADLDMEALIIAMKSVEGVDDVHHVHVWQLDESRRALEAHDVVNDGDVDHQTMIRKALKTRLKEEFQIGRSTIEVEIAGACDDPNETHGCRTA